MELRCYYYIKCTFSTRNKPSKPEIHLPKIHFQYLEYIRPPFITNSATHPIHFLLADQKCHLLWFQVFWKPWKKMCNTFSIQKPCQITKMSEEWIRNHGYFFFEWPICTCLAVICVLWLCAMYRNRSQAMAPMQKLDMMMGKSCPAFTNLQRISVLLPKGQWPSKVDQSVNGEVKLQRKKSEQARAKINEFRGSIRSFRVVSIV